MRHVGNDYFRKRARLWRVGVEGRLIEPQDAEAIEALWRVEEGITPDKPQWDSVKGAFVAPIPRRRIR